MERFAIRSVGGREVAWESGGHAWVLRGHRVDGAPVVDLRRDGAPLASLTVAEARDLLTGLEHLLGLPPRRPTGRAWSADEDRRLTEAFRAGTSIAVMATALDRSQLAVSARLVRLGLVVSRAAARRGERAEPK